MAHRIIISFNAGTDLHRVRNFGEALIPTLEQTDGRLSIQLIDTAIDKLEITDIHSKKLKRVLDYTAKCLVDHGLTLNASIIADK